MKFKIIGSGGCVSTPRPLCQCRVCVENWGKSYDDYVKIQNEYSSLKFAYDGMEIYI